MDGQSSCDLPAGGVDIDADLFVAFLGTKEKELSDDCVGQIVCDLAADEYYPILEKTRVDIHSSLASSCILDDVGNVVHRQPRWSALC